MEYMIEQNKAAESICPPALNSKATGRVGSQQRIVTRKDFIWRETEGGHPKIDLDRRGGGGLVTY